MITSPCYYKCMVCSFVGAGCNPDGKADASRAEAAKATEQILMTTSKLIVRTQQATL